MIEATPPTGKARGLLLLFSVALALRVVAILAFHSPQGVAKGPWEFGYEAACIAQSIHDGNGFAAQWQRAEPPWNQALGATGWLAPGYPALVALAMRIGGGLTTTAAWIVFLVQSVASALTCVFLVKLGAAMGAERAGRLAGWLLAFLPTAIWYSASVVWDTTFVALGVVVVMWATFAFRRAGLLAQALFGLGFGALLLVNPAPLVLVPVVGWVAWRARTSLAGFARQAFVVGACAFLVTLPWLARNQRELGLFALRTNLGVELDVGNNAEANGRFQVSRHPSNGAAPFQRYARLGEAEYARESMARVRAWIADNEGRFIRLTLVRATFFWFGVNPLSDERVDNAGARAIEDAKSWIKYLSFITVGVMGLVGAFAWARRAFEGRALLAIFALFPLVYYATHALERYRFPIEPLLVLCLSWVVCELRARHSLS